MHSDLIIAIVTFNPDFAHLNKTFASLKGFNIILVDNSCNVGIEKKLQSLGSQNSNLKCVFMKNNNGIANAFNQAAMTAMNQKSKYILFLDQDTEIEDSKYLNKLVEEYHSINDSHKIGLGCSFINAQTAKPYFLKYKLFTRKYYANSGVVEVDSLITSGMLVDLEKFIQSGMFDETLFMDFVDMEWSQRVKHLGYKIYGTFNIKLFHPIGQTFKLLNQSFPLHSPLRTKFMVKNLVILLTYRHVSFKFKYHEVFQMLLKFFFYVTFPAHRYAYLKSMLLGLWSAIRKIRSLT
jgi:rhamnosyltransferase